MPIKLKMCATALALYLITSAITNAASADVVAVVSAKSSVTSLTAYQLTDIFLGRSARFPDGTKAIPCDLAEDSPLRNEFYTNLIGKSQAQIKSHWSKLIFTGRGQPPREVATAEKAKQLVAENPNVICYIDRSQIDKSVTVLFPL
ncbi:phosphate ABC transporter substrate-binding protein [Candidatus Nitrotoga sp. M5]|uniref:phosphate ABC transporter substrate-binding protein n=1 Tax=Candidatus Nitrotoga sp. M5 TaxID=2890409 RepID=UPI001EF17E44|nr:phosphate ABC transporter substrate-binding protein [Candidatus Nitrotoga sp. M5]CAH1386806.1 conserved exported hypothetical protein [Candidatus Nitrotoga sp. M5]